MEWIPAKAGLEFVIELAEGVLRITEERPLPIENEAHAEGASQSVGGPPPS
jgi:hypothetical protein